MREEKKEIYIDQKVCNLIETVFYDCEDNDSEIAQEEIAKTLFDGSAEDTVEFLKLCEQKEMKPLLEGIVYYDYCRPLLEEFTEKTGYVIRWDAYNEKFYLPVPEDDIETLESLKSKKPGDQKDAEILQEIMDKKIPVKDLAIYAEGSYHSASIASAYYNDDTVELNQKGYDAAKRIIADFCFDGDESAADGFINIVSWMENAEENPVEKDIPFD